MLFVNHFTVSFCFNFQMFQEAYWSYFQLMMAFYGGTSCDRSIALHFIVTYYKHTHSSNSKESFLSREVVMLNKTSFISNAVTFYWSIEGQWYFSTIFCFDFHFRVLKQQQQRQQQQHLQQVVKGSNTATRRPEVITTSEAPGLSLFACNTVGGCFFEKTICSYKPSSLSNGSNFKRMDGKFFLFNNN